jgi:hypothetical protein
MSRAGHNTHDSALTVSPLEALPSLEVDAPVGIERIKNILMKP